MFLFTVLILCVLCVCLFFFLFSSSGAQSRHCADCAHYAHWADLAFYKGGMWYASEHGDRARLRGETVSGLHGKRASPSYSRKFV